MFLTTIHGIIHLSKLGIWLEVIGINNYCWQLSFFMASAARNGHLYASSGEIQGKRCTFQITMISVPSLGEKTAETWYENFFQGYVLYCQLDEWIIMQNCFDLEAGMVSPNEFPVTWHVSTNQEIWLQFSPWNWILWWLCWWFRQESASSQLIREPLVWGYVDEVSTFLI